MRLFDTRGDPLDLVLNGVRLLQRSGPCHIRLVSVAAIVAAQPSAVVVFSAKPYIEISSRRFPLTPRSFQIPLDKARHANHLALAATQANGAPRATGLSAAHRRLGHAPQDVIQRTLNVQFDSSETIHCRICAQSNNKCAAIGTGPYVASRVNPTRPLQYMSYDLFSYLARAHALPPLPAGRLRV